MELLKAIKGRRSIRAFTDKKVEKNIIDKIIDAANHAPSGGNYQLCRFIIIDNVDLKNKIVDMGGAIFIKDAPLVILVTYDKRIGNFQYKDYIQSASAAIQNMLLMAYSLGLGSCWACQLPPKNQLRKLLKIPSVYDPIACVVMGYPSRIPNKHPRKNKVDDIISYNKFNFKVEKIWNKDVRVLPRWAYLILRWVYMRLPIFFRKSLRPFVEKKFVKKFHN